MNHGGYAVVRNFRILVIYGLVVSSKSSLKSFSPSTFKYFYFQATVVVTVGLFLKPVSWAEPTVCIALNLCAVPVHYQSTPHLHSTVSHARSTGSRIYPIHCTEARTYPKGDCRVKPNTDKEGMSKVGYFWQCSFWRTPYSHSSPTNLNVIFLLRPYCLLPAQFSMNRLGEILHHRCPFEWMPRHLRSSGTDRSSPRLKSQKNNRPLSVWELVCRAPQKFTGHALLPV